MNALINYEAACSALQKAASIDEVLNIRDQSEAIRAYGKQAKNKELESYATEIRIRAERKLGELITKQKEEFGGFKKGRPSNLNVLPEVHINSAGNTTLSDLGISRNLSSRAQKIAAVPADEFEKQIKEHKEKTASENARVVNELETSGAAEIKKKAKIKKEDVIDVEENEESFDEIEQLQSALKAAIADNEMMGRVFDADDRIKAAMDECTRQKAIAENAERKFDAQQGKVKALATQVTHWQNKATKFEKELKRLQANHE